MDKKCNFCGNTGFRTAEIDYIYRQADRLLLVKNVPCEECEFCGEQYFEARVLKRIEADFEQIYSMRKKAECELTVPVEEFAHI